MTYADAVPMWPLYVALLALLALGLLCMTEKGPK